MADKPLIQFVADINNLNSRAMGVMSLDDVKMMSLPEFIQFENRILNFRKTRRYATGLWKNTVTITPEHKASLFTAGVGETVQWANDAADDIKLSRVHTNMPKKGEYQNGEVAIIRNFEAIVGFTAGAPTTTADGIASQPAVAAFPTNVDVFLLQDVVCGQFNLAFMRGNREVIFEGLLEDFPQTVGKSGASGAHAGAFSQNTAFGSPNMMTRPEVIEDDDDFEVEIQPLAPSLAMSTAARDIKIKVVYTAWEWLRNYA